MIQAKSGFSEFIEYQLDVISRVGHDEHMQWRHGLQSAEFFERAGFHWDPLGLLVVKALDRGIGLTTSEYTLNCRTTPRRNRSA